MNTVTKMVLNLQKIQTMVRMQHIVNDLTCPGYIKMSVEERPFYRCSWIESAEFADWAGYKWWKAQESNIPQCQLELVDIWHFVMSEYLVEGYDELGEVNIELVANTLMKDAQADYDFTNSDDLFLTVEDLVRETLNNRKSGRLASTHLPSFVRLCEMSGLDFEELFRQYVGKNSLNIFRQRLGYKDGSYNKEDWNGHEDNHYLEKIMAECDGDLTAEYVFGELARYYEQFTPGVKVDLSKMI